MRQAWHSAAIRSGIDHGRIVAGGVDRSRDDGDLLARNVVALHHRRGRKARRCDDAVAARETAGPEGGEPRRRRHIGQRGDEPDRDLRCRHVGAQRAARGMRVDDIDALAVDQLFEHPRAAPDSERIDRRVSELHPLAAVRFELACKWAILRGDQRAGTPLQQRVGNVERVARDRLFAERRDDLQDRRARERAGRRLGFAIADAHRPNPFHPPGATPILGTAPLQSSHGGRLRHGFSAADLRMTDSCLKSLDVGTGPAARRIAVRVREGGTPGVFWLGGFKSDMAGTKAVALDAWAAENGRAMTRFDYSGHGESGGDFAQGTIGRWLEESVAVFDAFCRGPQVAVGSSMGGWLALLLARELSRRTRPSAGAGHRAGADRARGRLHRGADVEAFPA